MNILKWVALAAILVLIAMLVGGEEAPPTNGKSAGADKVTDRVKGKDKVTTDTSVASLDRNAIVSVEGTATSPAEVSEGAMRVLTLDVSLLSEDASNPFSVEIKPAAESGEGGSSPAQAPGRPRILYSIFPALKIGERRSISIKIEAASLKRYSGRLEVRLVSPISGRTIGSNALKVHSAQIGPE